MSRANDRAAEREAGFKRASIRRARALVAYGKHYSARELAERIAFVRQELLKHYGTLEDGTGALMIARGKALLKEYHILKRKAAANDVIERKLVDGHAQIVGILLLKTALESPKLLGKTAEALRKLDDPGAEDPRAAAIITAYKECGSFPPIFGELKRAFIVRFGESRWRGDYSVRKTLRSLGLPLSKSKRGRPTGAKSVLKMVGIPQKRRKN